MPPTIAQKHPASAHESSPNGICKDHSSPRTRTSPLSDSGYQNEISEPTPSQTEQYKAGLPVGTRSVRDFAGKRPPLVYVAVPCRWMRTIHSCCSLLRPPREMRMPLAHPQPLAPPPPARPTARPTAPPPTQIKREHDSTSSPRSVPSHQPEMPHPRESPPRAGRVFSNWLARRLSSQTNPHPTSSPRDYHPRTQQAGALAQFPAQVDPPHFLLTPFTPFAPFAPLHPQKIANASPAKPCTRLRSSQVFPPPTPA